METTQHTPADVRGRIIRGSMLPIEDEETMIAGLRAGAEAVERGELDVDDFVGVWSQYLRQLLRASSVPAPADVREPTDAQINVWSIIRSALSRAWALSRPWAVADRPQVMSEVVARLDAIAADCEREVLTALRSEARGEVWREVDDLLARLERFEYDAAGESEAYWRVVAMRDRIAAAHPTDRSESDAE